MLVLAVVPAVATALLVVIIDRGREPWTAMAAMLAWGAVVAATLAAGLNALLAGWLADALGPSAGRALAPVIVGPVVEEVAKAVALVALLAAWRDRVDGVRDGIVYGALVGIGFAMAENVEYFTLAAVQGGPGGLRRSLYTRALLGALNHAVFSATTGAGIGWARRRPAPAGRLGPALAGLAAAIVEHIVWNRVAAAFIEQRLCGAPFPGGPCRETPAAADLLIAMPAVVAAFLAPVVAALAIAVARSTRDAARPRR
jgi:RsiW-degrading membrane proteinase PrsW (M82 family)